MLEISKLEECVKGIGTSENKEGGIRIIERTLAAGKQKALYRTQEQN